MATLPTPPQGFLPHLVVSDGKAAVEFYVKGLGASLSYQLEGQDGRLGHAELSLAGATFMLADEYPEMGFVGPKALGGTPVSLSLYVSDVDAVAARAIDAGAELERPITDEFYGDRVAHLRDPFGHRWTLHTSLEHVEPDEIRRRFAAMQRG